MSVIVGCILFATIVAGALAWLFLPLGRPGFVVPGQGAPHGATTLSESTEAAESISSVERERFADLWRVLQKRFPKAPGETVHGADQLVCDFMQGLGYPMKDFQANAEAIALVEPELVHNYLEAHSIALRLKTGKPKPEELRRAMALYSAVFDDLLGAQEMNGSRSARSHDL